MNSAPIPAAVAWPPIAGRFQVCTYDSDWSVSPPDYSRNAAAEALRLVSPDTDCGHWFTESTGRTDHRGDTETRSLHPPESITPASYGRIASYLESINA